MPKFEVLESIRIQAPIDTVVSKVRDFRSWPQWSPWLIAEPDSTITFAEDGRQYAWEGKIVGAGEMKVTGENLPDEIDYVLTFLKPWKSTADVRFSFQKDGEETLVSWRMKTALPLFMFWMIRMMTTMISRDFHRGLLMLKDLMETGEVPSKLEFIGNQTIHGFPYVGIKTRCSITEIENRMHQDFCTFQKAIADGSIQPTGNPLAVYHSFNMTKGITEYTLAFPCDASLSSVDSGFVLGELPSCEAYTIHHTGPYRHLGNAWSVGMMRAQAKVFRLNKKIDPFEIYKSNPDEVAENDLLTMIHFPLK